MGHPVIVCADDFGLSPGVNRAITALAQERRLSAISAMVCYADTHHDFQSLKHVTEFIDIGLHLRFSHPENGTELTPNCLLKGLSLSQNFSSHIENEILSQLQLFRELMNVVPRFIDGHRHLQVFPVIYRALSKVLQKHTEFQPYYFRGYRAMRCLTPQALALSALWTINRELAPDLCHRESPATILLSVRKTKGILEALSRLIQASTHPNDILVVHPGNVDETLKARDPILEHREACYQAMRSPEWLELLQKMGQLNCYV